MNYFKIGLFIAGGVAGVIGYKLYQHYRTTSENQPDNNEEDISVQDNAAAMQEENEEEQLG